MVNLMRVLKAISYTFIEIVIMVAIVNLFKTEDPIAIIFIFGILILFTLIYGILYIVDKIRKL